MRRYINYLLAVVLMGAGLVFFAAAEQAGATTIPGSCDVYYNNTTTIPNIVGSYTAPAETSFPDAAGLVCQNFPVNTETGFQVQAWTGSQEIQFQVYNMGITGHVATAMASSNDSWSYVGGELFNYVPTGGSGCGTAVLYVWNIASVSASCANPQSLIGNFQATASGTTQSCAAQGLTSGNSIATVCVFNGTAPPVAPCQLQSSQGPTTGQLVATDNVYAFTLVPGSGVSRILVSANASPAYSAGAPSNYAASTVTTGTNNPGTLNYTFSGNVTSATASDDVNLNGATVIPTTLNAWCAYTDTLGVTTWYSWGNLLTVSSSSCTQIPGSCAYNPNGGGTSCEVAAVANAGFSIDPASWVPGLVLLMGGELKCLFVPSTASTNSLEEVFGISSNAPTGADSASQWLGGMAKGIAAFPFAAVSSVQSVADGGGCSGSPLSDTDTLGGHSISACTILTSLSSLPSSASTDISWLQVILAAIIYIFGAMLLFHFIRGMVEQ